jgi:hypothetical protein
LSKISFEIWTFSASSSNEKLRVVGAVIDIANDPY